MDYNPEAELTALNEKKAALKAELDAERQKLREIQGKKKRLIENKIRREKYRLSLKERKRDTRRKILAGSWVLSIAENDQAAALRLRKGLDEFLARDQDRELFGLSPRPWTPPRRRPDRSGRPDGPEGDLTAHNCHLSRSGPGVSPEGPERSGGRRSR